MVIMDFSQHLHLLAFYQAFNKSGYLILLTLQISASILGAIPIHLESSSVMILLTKSSLDIVVAIESCIVKTGICCFPSTQILLQHLCNIISLSILCNRQANLLCCFSLFIDLCLRLIILKSSATDGYISLVNSFLNALIVGLSCCP